MPSIAVLIPGIMGSELQLNGETIWPGPLASLLLPYGLMDELLSDNLVATDVIRSYSISTQYQALIDDLGTLGFRESDRSLIICPYDWRRKNELAAEKLANLLDAALAVNPLATFILLGHSMGGLVARYYLESGDFVDRTAFSKVKLVAFLATPHRGAPVALSRVLGQEKVIWLNASQARQLTNDNRFPSAYQLLPPVNEPFSWDETPQAFYSNSNIYEQALTDGLRLNGPNLKAAQEFHAKLNPANRPAAVRYFCFGGTQQTTAALAAISKISETTYNVRKVERDDAGDGTVPFWSSSLPSIQCLPTGGEHSQIYKDRALRRTLAALLGSPGALGPAPFAAGRGPLALQVAIRDKVVEPGHGIHVSVVPFEPEHSLDVVMQIERAVDPTRADTTFTPEGPPLPVQYQGASIESLSLIADAPSSRGAYQIVFYTKASRRRLGSDAFFVQQPVQ